MGARGGERDTRPPVQCTPIGSIPTGRSCPGRAERDREREKAGGSNPFYARDPELVALSQIGCQA